jgi:hypothetical protein
MTRAGEVPDSPLDTTTVLKLLAGKEGSRGAQGPTGSTEQLSGRNRTVEAHYRDASAGSAFSQRGPPAAFVRGESRAAQSNAAGLSSLRTGGPSRQFHDRKRGERVVHSQALLALARRLVDVLWALLRDGREFTSTSLPPSPQPNCTQDH